MEFTSGDIAQALGAPLTGPAQLAADKFVFDSRSLIQGADTVFCAIKTSAADGHAFLSQMYRRGVRIFLVEKLPETPRPDAAYILTSDTRLALERLALTARQRLTHAQILGITGSAGKTVVKEMIYKALKDAGIKVWRSPRSWNSRLGVPVAMLNASADAEVYIFEAGIDSTGDMTQLARIIAPNIGILTSITDAHSAGFESLKAKVKEKCLLFTSATKIIYDSGSPEAAEMLGLLFPHKDRIAVSAQTPAATDRALAQQAIVSLGHSAHVAEETPMAINRIEVHQAPGGSLLLYDAFTADIDSLEHSLVFMRRHAAHHTDRVLITRGGSDADSPRLVQLYEDFALSRLIIIGQGYGGVEDILGPEGCVERAGSFDEFADRYSSADFSADTILLSAGPGEEAQRVYHTLEAPRHDSVFEIDLSALVHNFNTYRSLLPDGTGIVAMVKADAYGMGALEVAKTMQTQGAAYLAVAVVDEGVSLRRGGITMPIMVLNPVTANYAALFRYGLEPSIFSIAELKRLAAEADRLGVKQFNAHIKLDTGMHRVGFTPAEVEGLCTLLPTQPQVRVASIFSHLATADCPDQQGYTREQLATFERESSRLLASLPYPARRHILNTAGIETHPESHYDMVRLGLGLYGVSPVPDSELSLKTVATLKSTVISLKQWPAATTIGYGRRGVLQRPSVIATVPLGYADGIDRHLSRGVASFVVNGHKCPIVGNVCMDQLMLDVTDVPGVTVGTEVEVFGHHQPVQDIAAARDTIPYEVFTSVSPRVARIYFRD